jgi:hypothetical protein
VDAEGRVVVRRQLRRKQVRNFFAGLVPCLIGMEAWGVKWRGWSSTILAASLLLIEFPVMIARLVDNATSMANMSLAETKCAKWRRESVPVGLRVKGFEAPVYDGAFSSIDRVPLRGVAPMAWPS